MLFECQRATNIIHSVCNVCLMPRKLSSKMLTYNALKCKRGGADDGTNTKVRSCPVFKPRWRSRSSSAHETLFFFFLFLFFSFSSYLASFFFIFFLF